MDNRLLVETHANVAKLLERTKDLPTLARTVQTNQSDIRWLKRLFWGMGPILLGVLGLATKGAL
jgi:hypothetical protein